MTTSSPFAQLAGVATWVTTTYAYSQDKVAMEGTRATAKYLVIHGNGERVNAAKNFVEVAACAHRTRRLAMRHKHEGAVKRKRMLTAANLFQKDSA